MIVKHIERRFESKKRRPECKFVLPENQIYEMILGTPARLNKSRAAQEGWITLNNSVANFTTESVHHKASPKRTFRRGILLLPRNPFLSLLCPFSCEHYRRPSSDLFHSGTA